MSYKPLYGARARPSSGPHRPSIGAPLVDTFQALRAQPSTVYLFDVSLAGSTPGIPLPPAINGPFPLNQPLLNRSFGPFLPGVFVDFLGLLNPSGQATPILNIPNVPALIGQTLHAAAITLEPQGPFGLGIVSNGAQTLIQ